MNFKIHTYLILHPSRRDKIDPRWLSDKDVNIFDAIVPPKWKSEEVPPEYMIKQLGASSHAKGCSGWSLSSGEMGCLLSHHAITDRAVREEHDYTLILEDELKYRDGWMYDLQELMSIPDSPPDILTLLQRKGYKKGDPQCKRKVISEKPYLDIVTDLTGGQGNTKAWLYSQRSMKWLYGMYNEKDWLAAADGYIHKHSIANHEKQTGEKLVWMTTGNYTDHTKEYTFFKLFNTPTTIYGRKKRNTK